MQVVDLGEQFLLFAGRIADIIGVFALGWNRIGLTQITRVALDRPIGQELDCPQFQQWRIGQLPLNGLKGRPDNNPDRQTPLLGCCNEAIKTIKRPASNAASSRSNGRRYTRASIKNGSCTNLFPASPAKNLIACHFFLDNAESENGSIR